MKTMRRKEEVFQYLGVHSAECPKETLFSSIIALVSIFCVMYLSEKLITLTLGQQSVTHNLYILTSIAASTVLVFAVPHGPLSQPWPVIGGNFLSASVGVLCWQYFSSDLLLSAALSIALAIFVMTIFRCLHPPGGATALGAVLGGDEIHTLGFGYLFTPTLLNSILIVLLAIIINIPFAWRRYPAHFRLKNLKVN